MNVSIAIQAHPKRAPMAETLRHALWPHAEIAYDPEPQGSPNPWRCFRHALETTPAGASHRVVLQDDCTPCPVNFVTALHVAVRARPDRLLVLFHGGQPWENVSAIHQSVSRGDAWVALDASRWCPVVATVWPVRLIPMLTAWVDGQRFPPAFRADDEITGRFLRENGEYALACTPSLVQHEDMVASLVGRRSRQGQDPGRVASCWVADCDPLTMDWDRGAS